MLSQKVILKKNGAALFSKSWASKIQKSMPFEMHAIPNALESASLLIDKIHFEAFELLMVMIAFYSIMQLVLFLHSTILMERFVSNRNKNEVNPRPLFHGL